MTGELERLRADGATHPSPVASRIARFLASFWGTMTWAPIAAVLIVAVCSVR